MHQHASFTVADKIIDRINAHDILTDFWSELDIIDRTMFTAEVAALVESYNPTIAPPHVGQSVIDLLKTHGGFDHWWYSLHSQYKAEILADLDRLVVHHTVGGDLNAYQARAHATSKNTQIDDPVIYPVLGLCSEVADKVKKVFRDKDGVISDDDREAIKLEIAGCLWHVAEIATQLGLTLADVAAANLAARGVISGNGDHR